MKSCIRLILASLICCFYSNVQAQSLFFEHLGKKDGLSQHTIHNIYQDEFEQIWIATNDGLNKYDGNKITIYRPVIGDDTGLFGNNIQNITGNKKGKLFIQCLSGLVEYDLYNESFKIIEKKGVACFFYGKDRLWIGNNNTVRYLDSESNIIKFKDLDENTKTKVILEASDGDLYIGTDKGIIILDKNAMSSKILENIHIVCLYEDNMKRIWVGTLKDGIFCINSRGEISNYKNDPNNPHSLSNNFIRAICQDDLDGFWIGTFNGLDYFNQETKSFQNFKYSGIDNNSISDLSVWCIQKDVQGSLWIGTFFGGVNLFNPQYSFNRFYRPTENNRGPSNAIISKVIEDANNNLWICTDYDGLNFFDSKRNSFTYFKHNRNDNKSLSSNTIKDLLLDQENNALWIGSHLGGLDKLDLLTKNITRIKLGTGNNAIDNYVRSIQKYKNNLLLGTHDAIQVYNLDTKEVTPLLKKSYEFNKGQVWDMLVDSQQRLWFSIHSMILCYDLKKDLLLEDLEITEIEHGVFFEDSKGNIWIGTAGKGIFKYETDGNLLNFNTQNSDISDNYILDIKESATGYILIATNRGLSRLAPSEKEFYNYHNNRFFPFEALNEKSLCVTQRGDIILSSLSGMMMITEKDLLINPKPYKINHTAININNKLLSPDQKDGVLHESIITTDAITLSEGQNVISIDFAITNYIKALAPQIQYKLEGFDDEWIDSKSFTITYTNLNPGTYNLKIRGIDQTSGSQTDAKDLEIVIKPFFYKTWYAYLLYISLIIGLFYLIYLQLRLRDSLKNADLQSKHTEEINQSKLRFFINVSHEIRTPVTLMIAQLDILLNNTPSIPPTVHNKLQSIKSNASSLKKLINELLDFRKHEQGFAKLRVEKKDLVKYLNNIFDSFQDYANSLNINTSFISSEDYIELLFDPVQMDKVFYNLLSNAFKFTPPLGSVSLSIKRNGELVEIIVEDTGIGIKPESISEIFNRFYQAQDSDTSIHPLDPGTGIGLSLVKNIIELHRGTISVLSNWGRGTAFKIVLPITNVQPTEINTLDNNVLTKSIENNEIEEVNAIGTKDNTVMIVEDNDEIRNILIEIFSPIYNVVSLSTGKDAFEKIKQTTPDLILLDIMLPHTSGIDLCKKIKSDLTTRSIPVVLLTATVSAEKKFEGLKIGADDYITKPFDTKELIIRCNGLINNRKLLKNAYASIKDNEGKIFSINQQDQQIIDRATHIILNNIDNQDFSIDHFASEMNISRSSLFTKIKEITGETPKDFIIKTRLKKSIDLLKNSNEESINSISFAVGFSDPSYFIKLFKSHYGVTPGQYKNNLKSEE